MADEQMQRHDKPPPAAPDPYRTRKTLLARVNDRDPAGWSEFYALYSPLITWLCARRGLRNHEARQLVVQAVMRHFATTEWNYDADKGRFRNLVLKVAQLKIHEVARELRPTVRGAHVPLEDTDLPAPDDSALIDREEREQVRLAMAALAADPTIQPRHLWIFGQFLDGASTSTIAAQTGESPANLHVIKHRMLSRIRAVIFKEEDR